MLLIYGENLFNFSLESVSKPRVNCSTSVGFSYPVRPSMMTVQNVKQKTIKKQKEDRVANSTCRDRESNHTLAG